MLVWYSAALLAFEAAEVIGARLQMLARGTCTTDELFLMVSEKFDAMEQAQAIVVRGGHPEMIIDNYRKIIAANAERLSIKSSAGPWPKGSGQGSRGKRRAKISVGLLIRLKNLLQPNR
jgi:hypothetical protein